MPSIVQWYFYSPFPFPKSGRGDFYHMPHLSERNQSVLISPSAQLCGIALWRAWEQVSASSPSLRLTFYKE